MYQLIDQYTLFYFKFVVDNLVNDEHFWTKSIDKPIYNTWCGLAFERICLLHSRQIKAALGISGIISSEYSWFVEGDEKNPGAQIDLLIDRSDGVINLCEIKFSKSTFKIDAKFELSLQNKRTRFIETTGTEKSVVLTMITLNGIYRNSYSNEIYSQITIDKLFTF